MIYTLVGKMSLNPKNEFCLFGCMGRLKTIDGISALTIKSNSVSCS